MAEFRGRAARPKKASCTNYDDVFGGPPKFAAPFTATINDYTEIFGHFSTSCSIPFLDLPHVPNANGEVVSGVDYAEVFGGFEFRDFALPYEDLLVRERGNKEATFDQQAKEASGILSQPNEPSFDSPEDDKIRSHSDNVAGLVSERTCGTTHVSERHAVPEFNDVISVARSPSQCKEIDDHCGVIQDDISATIPLEKFPSSSSPGDGSRGTVVELENSQKQNNLNGVELEKDNASIQQLLCSSSSQSGSSIEASFLDTKYVSISDISLRTRPSRGPPPSRPPPKPADKLGHSTLKTNPYFNDTNNASLRKPTNSEKGYANKAIFKSQTDKVKEKSTDFFGMEVDFSYEAATSAVAMKEAMEQAEARLRIVKESVERKREYLQNSKMVDNEDNKRKDRKPNKISSFSERTKTTDNKTTDQMASQEITEIRNAAYKILMQKDIVEEEKVIDIILSDESAKDTDAAQVNYISVETERNAKQANEFPEMVLGITTKSPQLLGKIEEDYENCSANKENFEQIYNQKLQKNVVIFENKAVMQTTESSIEINDDGKNLSPEAALPSDLESHSNLQNEHKKCGIEESITMRNEMEKNVARQEILHEKEEDKAIPNMIPEDSWQEENIDKVELAIISHEDENLEKDEILLAEVRLQYDNVQGSTSGGSEKNLDCAGNHEFQLVYGTEEKERISEAGEACENVTNSSSSDENNDGGEEKAVPDKCKENGMGENENSSTVADGTNCEPCDYGRKLNDLDATPGRDENGSKSTDEATDDCRAYQQTFREEKIKLNSVENRNEENQARGAQWLDAVETKILNKILFTWEDNVIQPKINQETGRVLDDLDNQERQDVTQQFEEQKPMADATSSLKQDFTGTKIERSEEELKQNYKKDDSDQMAYSMENSEVQMVECHNLDKTANVRTDPELDQRPMVGQLDIQQTAWYERQGSILSSAVDIKETHCIASEKVSGDMKKMEFKQKESILEKEELIESKARKLEENKELEKNRERETERVRDREREKDRIAVERETREAVAKEREQRVCVERVTAEVRERALKEAREKVEKASAEAPGRSLANKAERESRLRAEPASVDRATTEAWQRAAVDRATIEARDRAARKALAAMDAKEQTERYTTALKYGMKKESATNDHVKARTKDGPYAQFENASFSRSSQGHGESALRYKARLERYQREADSAAKALADLNMRETMAQKEQAERNRIAKFLDADVKRWSNGKEGNLRALLSTLQYILGPESGWKPILLTEIVTADAMRKAYKKATLFVHPDKLQQKGANIQQKYICEKVFELLKEAWNKYSSQER